MMKPILVTLLLALFGVTGFAATANAHGTHARGQYQRHVGIPPRLRRTVIRSDGQYRPGTVVVDDRRAYYYHRNGLLYGFPVAIGREGFAWSGVVRICKIDHNPRWTPTQRMIREDNAKPRGKKLGLARYWPHGMGDWRENPNNPFSKVAIRLCANGKYSGLNFHGTPKKAERSVGEASSSGCFRMYDEHALELARLVRLGDRVVVLP